MTNGVGKAVVYVKDVQDIGFFTMMVDTRLYQAFVASPLYYIILPVSGLLTTLLALMNAYQFAKASNRNLDAWLQFIFSSVCAVLASVSLYGAILTTALGLVFTAGPWLFLSGLTLAFVHQALMMGLNFYRASESLDGASQQKHYLQAAINNGFVLGLLTAMIGTVVFVMITPVAPYLGSAFAISSVVFVAANLLWRLIPSTWKQGVKAQLNLAKPEAVFDPMKLECSLEKSNTLVQFNFDSNYIDKNKRLFTQIDYGAEIEKMDVKSAKEYLRMTIQHKILVLNDKSIVLTEKRKQKLHCLNELYSSLDSHNSISKEKILEQYPSAFQSFWADKGEVEQIYDAVKIFQEKHNKEEALHSNIRGSVIQF